MYRMQITHFIFYCIYKLTLKIIIIFTSIILKILLFHCVKSKFVSYSYQCVVLTFSLKFHQPHFLFNWYIEGVKKLWSFHHSIIPLIWEMKKNLPIWRIEGAIKHSIFPRIFNYSWQLENQDRWKFSACTAWKVILWVNRWPQAQDRHQKCEVFLVIFSQII